MHTTIDAEVLGHRIRKLRGDMRMTLKQVEEQSGLSATHLSEIERGRTSPTIGALVRIARAMEKDAAFFLEAEVRADAAILLREHVRPLKGFPGAKVEALTAGIPGGTLSAYRVQLPPGAEPMVLTSRHDLVRDVIFHMHAGRIAAGICGTQVELGAGDTMQVTLGETIRIQAQGGSVADFHLVMSEPLEARS